MLTPTYSLNLKGKKTSQWETKASELSRQKLLKIAILLLGKNAADPVQSDYGVDQGKRSR